jgi:hypothetical protein
MSTVDDLTLLLQTAERADRDANRADLALRVLMLAVALAGVAGAVALLWAGLAR